MPGRAAIVAGLIAVVGIWPATALGVEPVRLTVRFDHGARLGGNSAMDVELAVDPRRLPSPVTELRVLYPEGLGLVASGLGLVACTRPAIDYQQVLIEGSGLDGCSPNAVLGYGSARAEVRLLDGHVIPEYATLTVLSGTYDRNALGLVALMVGQHPFGAFLAYAGALRDLRSGRDRFGGALSFHVPPIPAIVDLATVALTDLRLVIGSHAIVYYGHPRNRTGAYHPAGVALPVRCPRQGLRFRVQLTFQNGGHAAADTTVRCPPPGGVARARSAHRTRHHPQTGRRA